jgi:hypothetical protein
MSNRLLQLVDPVRFAAKLDAWINTLPEFWRPIAGGASIIVTFMAARGAAFLLPIVVIYVLLASGTPLADLARFAGFLLIAISAGALSGLMYALVGKRLRRFGAAGYYVSAVVTLIPYMLVLVHLDLDRTSRNVLHRADTWDYGFAAIASIVVGSLFGHAFYKRDQRKASLAAPAT